VKLPSGAHFRRVPWPGGRKMLFTLTVPVCTQFRKKQGGAATMLGRGKHIYLCSDYQRCPPAASPVAKSRPAPHPSCIASPFGLTPRCGAVVAEDACKPRRHLQQVLALLHCVAVINSDLIMRVQGRSRRDAAAAVGKLERCKQRTVKVACVWELMGG
jgi:hypothetical protein